MKYIETSWNSYREMVVPKDAGTNQLNETRQAFYSGACTLFTSIMLVLDPGEEPTDRDMQRLSDIQSEIDSFGAALDRKLIFGTREN